MQKTLSLWKSPLAASNRIKRKEWVCNCSSRILGIVPVTSLALFSVMFLNPNQCNIQS
jgi:hypothetical protein